MGKENRSEGWYNLKNQNFQPSTPSATGHFTHYYEDAFNGGSCLSIDTNELIKIFTSEFSLENGVIFSYSFKREHSRNDVRVHLNIVNLSNNREIQIVCGNEEDENGPLNYDAVRKVNIHLATNGHIAIPSMINDWETRFFLIKAHRHAIITDIGVKKLHAGRVLLGQISFYSAKDFENYHEIKGVEIDI